MQPALDRIVCEDLVVGLELNTSKTKFFTTSRDPLLCIHVIGDLSCTI